MNVKQVNKGLIDWVMCVGLVTWREVWNGGHGGSLVLSSMKQEHSDLVLVLQPILSARPSQSASFDSTTLVVCHI